MWFSMLKLHVPENTVLLEDQKHADRNGPRREIAFYCHVMFTWTMTIRNHSLNLPLCFYDANWTEKGVHLWHHHIWYEATLLMSKVYINELILIVLWFPGDSRRRRKKAFLMIFWGSRTSSLGSTAVSTVASQQKELTLNLGALSCVCEVCTLFLSLRGFSLSAPVSSRIPHLPHNIRDRNEVTEQQDRVGHQQ